MSLYVISHFERNSFYLSVEKALIDFECIFAVEDCERNDGIEDESYELQRPLANIPVKKGAPMRSSYKK